MNLIISCYEVNDILKRYIKERYGKNVEKSFCAVHEDETSADFKKYGYYHMTYEFTETSQEKIRLLLS